MKVSDSVHEVHANQENLYASRNGTIAAHQECFVAVRGVKSEPTRLWYASVTCLEHMVDTSRTCLASKWHTKDLQDVVPIMESGVLVGNSFVLQHSLPVKIHIIENATGSAAL